MLVAFVSMWLQHNEDVKESLKTQGYTVSGAHVHGAVRDFLFGTASSPLQTLLELQPESSTNSKLLLFTKTPFYSCSYVSYKRSISMNTLPTL